MRNAPGQNDRLIGRKDTGGQGGGMVAVPIFHSIDNDKANFFSKPTDRFVGPPPINAFEESGLVRILFIPNLFHYSLETHYGEDRELNKEEKRVAVSVEEQFSRFRRLNWEELVGRLGVDPRSQKAVDRVIKAITPAVLAPFESACPNPQDTFLEVHSTMLSQVVKGESRSFCITPPGRLEKKLQTQARKRVLSTRIERALEERLQD